MKMYVLICCSTFVTGFTSVRPMYVFVLCLCSNVIYYISHQRDSWREIGRKRENGSKTC